MNYYNLLSFKVMYEMTRNIMNISYILSMVGFEHIKYWALNRDHYRLVVNIADKISRFNIIYVKIFQGICNNSRILSKEEQAYLLKFTDNVPFSDGEVDYELLNYIGDKYPEIEIDLKPINSGVCAIVYKGKYTYQKEHLGEGDDSGERKDICVKILKKGIRERVDSAIGDLKLLFWMFDYIPYLRDINLSSLLNNNKQMFIDQMDFTMEAAAQTLFREKYSEVDWLKIPEIIRLGDGSGLYQDRMICMEYVEGMKLSSLTSEDKTHFSRLLYRLALSSALFYNAIHADLHSGNMLFVKEVDVNVNDDKDKDKDIGTESGYKYRYRLVILDFGLCIFPSADNQALLYTLLKDMFVKKSIAFESLINNVMVAPLSPRMCIDSLVRDMSVSLKNRIISEINREFQTHMLNNYFGPDSIINMNIVLRKYGLQYSPEADKLFLSIAVAGETGKSLSPDWIDIMGDELKKFQKIYEMFEF